MALEYAYYVEQLNSSGEDTIISYNDADNGGAWLSNSTALDNFIDANPVIFGKKVNRSTPGAQGITLRRDLEAPPASGSSVTASNTTPSQYEEIDIGLNLADPSSGFVNIPFEYHWDFGDGNTLATDYEPVKHSYADTGTYTITLKMVNDAGNDTITQTDLITVS